MLKKIPFFMCGLSLCCIAMGALGLMLSLKDLKNTERKTYEFTGEILSYDYNQYNKYASYYFQTNINGELTTLEIPDLYLAKFRKVEFEKTYSSSNIYTFVVLQEDYNSYDVVPIVGLKNNSAILLDENFVLRSISFNSQVGLIFCALLFIAGITGAILRYFLRAKGWFS